MVTSGVEPGDRIATRRPAVGVHQETAMKRRMVWAGLVIVAIGACGGDGDCRPPPPGEIEWHSDGAGRAADR